ncbi:Uncharacterised protein [Xylophilus ampelinus]|nr:Uncharacterised protein [Xylophilus ampelinus]
MSRGAPAEALNAGAAAALAVFSRADVDPWSAIEAMGKVIQSDELGFSEGGDHIELEGVIET